MIKTTLQKAFSIIELLLVLVLFGIILFIAIPNWNGFLGKNRALIYANELKSALQFARVSAIKLGEPVTFCGSKSRESCDGLWREGQIVFIGSDEVLSGKILRVLPGIFGGDRLSWKGGAISKDRITFFPSGSLNERRGSFRYYLGGDSKCFIKVVLESTGRIRVDEC